MQRSIRMGARRAAERIRNSFVRSRVAVSLAVLIPGAIASASAISPASEECHFEARCSYTTTWDPPHSGATCGGQPCGGTSTTTYSDCHCQYNEAVNTDCSLFGNQYKTVKTRWTCEGIFVERCVGTIIETTYQITAATVACGYGN